jgi:hypothetical protein
LTSSRTTPVSKCTLLKGQSLRIFWELFPDGMTCKKKIMGKVNN